MGAGPRRATGRRPSGRWRRWGRVRPRELPLAPGIRPVRRHRPAREALAGLTLAAVAVPEVMGYARIAGMPVVTGLYTILLPLVVFAVVGSSRHLVVGADSATAAMTAAGVAVLATAGSAHYVALAGLVALLTAGLLLLARAVRLGVLGNFLSRTVLVGFLAGVGVQVAVGQLPDVVGVPVPGTTSVTRLVGTVRVLGQAQPATVAVSAAVVALLLACRLVDRRIPGALLAVAGSIVAARAIGLQAHGVALIGEVPGGLPALALPALSLSAAAALLPTAAGISVVVLAQSTATARAYAARYEEELDENTDLVGLGLANAAAACSGAFVVNGSPTKTQIVDDAGGRSQLASLVAAVGVLLTLLFLTGPLAYLPVATLASIVLVIAVELVDVRALRRILAARADEFAVAMITAIAVVVLGVGPGIALAVVASMIDHLRISCAPPTAVLVPDARAVLRPVAVTPEARTAPGLVLYRFTNTLYYANVQRLADDVHRLLGGRDPLRCFCLDCVAVGDVDYTAGTVLRQVHDVLAARGVRLAFSEVSGEVRAELDRYGITRLVGPDGYFDTPMGVLAAGAPRLDPGRAGRDA
jgi:sulfate permease, SulP family